jgi:hypothetical protein
MDEKAEGFGTTGAFGFFMPGADRAAPSSRSNPDATGF